MPVNNYRQAVDSLLELQAKLKHRPERKKINPLVQQLIKGHKLHGEQKYYFFLLATCALLGKEPLYNNYKPKRRPHKRR